MVEAGKVRRIVGLVIHLLVGGLMIFAGSSKLLAPAKFAEMMANYGIADKVILIGAGELISAVLLLVPITMSLGLLLTSAFWGGVICTHMSHGESYVMG